MYLEQLPDLKYKDPKLQYVEYTAILRFIAEGDDVIMAKRYPDVASYMSTQGFMFVLDESDTFRGQAVDMIREGKLDHLYPSFALAAVYRFLDSEGNILPDFGEDDDVIETAKPVATPIRNTNAEIQKKKRDQKQIASEVYQRKRLGDAAVPKVLYAEARQRVDEHLHGGGTREDLTPMASQLALDNNLTEDQKNTLLNEIMLKYFDRLNHHNVIEQELLSNPSQLNKSIFYLWHQLSRRYEVGVSFPLPTNEGRRMAAASKTTWPELIKTMRKMKILQRLDTGQRGANSKKATTYKLLVSVSG